MKRLYGATRNEMNTEQLIQPSHNQEVEYQLRRWLPLAVGAVVAVAAGYWVGNNDWMPLYKSLAVFIVVFVAFSLQERGWIIIPMVWLAYGKIGLLPVPFTWHDVGILLAVAAYIAHRCMVKTAPVPMGRLLDWLIALNVLWVAIAWMRNPTGFLVLRSEYVGARVYVDMTLAAMAAWVMIRLPKSPRQIMRLPYYMLIGPLIGVVLSLIVWVIPSMYGALQRIYGQIDVSLLMGMEMSRFGALVPFGSVLVLIAVTYYPLSHLLNPFRWSPYLILIGFVAILAGGYRSVLLGAIMSALMAIWLRGGRKMVLIATLGFSLALGVVLMGQGRLYSLPLSWQRALSFLPAQWSEVALRDAQGTAGWRFELWQKMLRYGFVENWWMGDCISLRLAEMGVVTELGRFDFNQIAEFTLAYHNGPLCSIKMTGLIGLALLYILMIATLVQGYDCVRKSRGTILFPVAVFVTSGVAWHLFCFTIVYGGYTNDMVTAMFNAALVRLVKRMLEERPAELAPA